MIERIQRAVACSREGAVGLIKGVLACAFQNIAFMLPTTVLYFLVADLMNGQNRRTAFYVIGCILCFAAIFLTTWVQYNDTFFTTYRESGCRRLNLAERLRRLPRPVRYNRDGHEQRLFCPRQRIRGQQGCIRLLRNRWRDSAGVDEKHHRRHRHDRGKRRERR